MALVGARPPDDRVEVQSTATLNYRFSEYSFFREFWSNPDLKQLLIELMPAWLGNHVSDGTPLEEAAIQDFLQDQPMVKFPYFTMGEVDAEDIKAFVARCNAKTFTP